MHGGSGDDLWIVGGEQTAFTAVHVLVGLGAETRDFAKRTRSHAIPARAHGVRTVLDQNDTVLLAQIGNSMHIGQVSAHV